MRCQWGSELTELPVCRQTLTSFGVMALPQAVLRDSLLMARPELMPEWVAQAWVLGSWDCVTSRACVPEQVTTGLGGGSWMLWPGAHRATTRVRCGRSPPPSHAGGGACPRPSANKVLFWLLPPESHLPCDFAESLDEPCFA